MSSDPPLNAMPRMPTVSAGQVVPLLQPVDQVQRQALVDRHRRVAEREVVVVERGQLHRVLEQARPGGEPGAGHVRRPRVVLGQARADPLEVEAAVVGHHVELVGRRELDVAPGVGEQLGQLGLLGRQLDDRVGQPREQRRRPAPGPAGCGPDTICGSANSSVIALPSAIRSGQNATSISTPEPGDHPLDQRRHPGEDRASAAPAAARRAGTARSRRGPAGSPSGPG